MRDKFFAWMNVLLSAFWMLWVTYSVEFNAGHHRWVLVLFGVPVVVVLFYLLSVDLRKLIAAYRNKP